MTDKLSEADFMQSLIPQLRSEGYEVYLQPTAPLCRHFLRVCAPTQLPSERAKS